MADFQICRQGGQVICTPAPDASEADIEHLYLNQVLPLVLSALGTPVFHASAVELCGGAVAFVATTGRGKSTLAAAFTVAGNRLMTDDSLILSERDGQYDVIPSHPSIRLWEDSLGAILPTGLQPTPSLSFTSKSRFNAGGQIPYGDQPRRFLGAYFLGEAICEEILLHQLSEAEALREWTKHSFLLDVQDRDNLREHFDRVSTLAAAVPCFRLDYPRRFAELERVRDAVSEKTAALV
ncbi:phosphoenolpyruvate carboxykinase (ATP) [Terricaulis silvestris]|uniref:hypothetical protein n=1 Tax=Terricaulis silvestris TaxID=2686094 RepID=UPI00131D094B|nr:hypothetical protein [Terricaulis silvestris]